ncbi:MAG: twin-arginine translocase TatA/TatE family subunit [Planctomycetes bacterium]|nr:twin-arginine translocase TatA/TatE family subunit [Planctomycetota bacterium]
MTAPAFPTAYLAFLGGYEWVVILVIVLLLFGHRIPGMARALGGGIVEFKKGLRGDDHEKIDSPPSGSDKGD